MAAQAVSFDESTATPLPGAQPSQSVTFDDSTAVPLPKAASVQSQPAGADGANQPFSPADRALYTRPVNPGLATPPPAQQAQPNSSLQAPPAQRPVDTVEAAPPPTYLQRAESAIRNSVVGRALHMDPTESESELQRTGDRFSTPDLWPDWAKKPLVFSSPLNDQNDPQLAAEHAQARQNAAEFAQKHPKIAAIEEGVENAGGAALQSLVTPETLAKGALASVVPAVIPAYIGQAASGIPDEIQAGNAARDKGDIKGATEHYVAGGIDAVTAAAMAYGVHEMARGGYDFPAGKPKPSVEIPSEPRALPAPPQPIDGEYIGEPAAPPQPGDIIEGEGIPIPKPTVPAPATQAPNLSQAEAALTGKPIEGVAPAAPTIQPNPDAPTPTPPPAAPQAQPEARRPPVQASTDPSEIRQSAQEQKPDLKEMASNVAAAVPGAEVVGPRVKSADSIDNKEDRGKPVESNIDNLGVRVVAPNPDAVPEVQKAVENVLPVASKDTIENNGLNIPQYGVKTGGPGDPNQVSELQVVPSPEVADAMKDTDPLYAKQKEAIARGDKAEADRLGTEIQAKFDAARSQIQPSRAETVGRAQSPEQAVGAGKPAPAAITKGSQVTLPDGTNGAVQHVNPNYSSGGRVVVQTPNGIKTFKGSELKPAQNAPGPVGAPLPERVAQIKDVAAKGTPVKIFTARGDDPQVKQWLQQQGLGNLPVTNVKGHDFGALLDNEVNVPTNSDKPFEMPAVPAGKALYVDLDGTLATEREKPNEQRNSTEQPASAVAEAPKPKEGEETHADEITSPAPRAVGEGPESGAEVRGRHAEGVESTGETAVERAGGKEDDQKEVAPSTPPIADARKGKAVPVGPFHLQEDPKGWDVVDSKGIHWVAATTKQAADEALARTQEKYPVAKPEKEAQTGSREHSEPHPAGVDTAQGGRPSSDTQGADRKGVEAAPSEVRESPRSEENAPEGNRPDSVDVRRNAEPVPEQGAGSGPGAGSDTGIDSTPGADVAKEATKTLTKTKALNREWFAHPEAWHPPSGTVARLEANLAAIRIVRDIEKNPRKLTDGEREALSNYVGWGSLPHTFEPYGAPRDEQSRWSKANQELQKLLSPDELARARESTKNAHYTSPELVRFMWDTMQRFGFKAGNVLEPAVGTGNFLGMMPKAIRSKSSAVTNELDTISHAITKMLYPEAVHFNKDFAELILPDNDFDLAIGNPPFGGYKLYDPAYKKLNALVHDFFFVKSLDKVRPGGVLAFITSTGTLDKVDPSIRNAIASKADFLGAIRLPSGAFKVNAGTDVTTDLVFLQKRAPGQEPDHMEDWIGSTQTDVPGKYGMEKLNVNEYFQKHPEMMLGRPSASTKMYGGVGFVLEPHADSNIIDLLKEAQKALPRGIYKDPIQQATGNSLSSTAAEFAPDNLKEGQYTIDSKGALKQNVKGKLVNPEAVLDKAGNPQLSKVQRFRGLVGVRDSMNRLLGSMLTEPNDEQGNAAVAKLRTALEKDYNKFVEKFGYLNSIANGVFRDDPHYPRLLALENYDKAARTGTPADIFRRRTIFPREEITQLPKDIGEAFQLILAERGFPDVKMMARLRGEPVADVVKSLQEKGLIYRNPATGSYETRETYLSGYVRDKLRDAKRAVKQGSAEYAPNVEALEKVVPPDIEIGDDPKTSVSVRLGSTWIPTQAIEDFIRATFKTPGEVKYLMGNWKVNGVRATAEVTGEFGTPRVYGDSILEDTLNQRQVTVFDTDKDGKRTLNADATTAAQAAQEKLRKAFQAWSVKSDWKPELQRLYNDAYNNLAQVEYDGSHLTFPGKNPDITLQPHQVNATWRGVQDGRALLAHEVGAGKTFEMAAIAMESRRVGTAKKPMITVPNHIVEQFRQEFLHLYPGANLLVPTEKDFDSKNRQRIMSRIATGDYDAVILPHSQFNLMDISPERQRVTIQAQKEELRQTIEALKAENGEKRTVKQLENAMAKMDASLKKLADLKADNAIYFDNTGVDLLMVDEAHMFKNLSFYTKMTRIAGLQQAKAKSALRLKMKTEFLQDRNNGRGVIFATGTPVQNTMAELYTMMKYVAPDVLEKAGIHLFDDWAANFGSVITAMELAADGRSYKARAKFAQFQNVPELMNMFRSFADIKTAEDLDLPTPELETGKPIVVPVPASARLEEYVGELMERAAAVKSGSVRPETDNMLKITTDGRKAATDMRLIDSTLPDDADSKINTAIDKMYEEWKDGKDDIPEGPTTQMAFLDLYRAITEDAAGKERELLNLYNDMANKLVARGVPANQIAKIGDYPTRIKRQQLFAAMNRGEVRILLGSTQRMGAGTNAQRLLKALHHIDLTWRPGDLAQRNGRIMRQGNLNKSVRQYNYLTERSFDAYMAQTLQGKAEFIAQIFSGRLNQRVMADVASEMVLSLEEMKIAASGNPDVKLQYDLQMQKAQLQSLQRSFESQRRSNEQEAWSAESRATRLETEVKTLSAAQKTIKEIEGSGEEKGIKVQLDGKTLTDRKSLTEYLETMQVPKVNFHLTWNGIGVAVEHAENWANKEPFLKYTFEYGGTFSAPKMEMQSLARSIEARMRNIGDEIESAKVELPRLREKAQRLRELAERKDFPEKDKLDKVESELDAVEKRLGIRSAVDNAMAQAVTAEVVDEPEQEELADDDEVPVDDEGDEQAEGLDRLEANQDKPEPPSSIGTKLYSGFGDPELFKELFPDIGQRIADWTKEPSGPGVEQKAMMRETRGQMDRRVAIAIHALRKEAKAWRTRSREDSMKFWNAVEQGNVGSLPPKDQALAAIFKQAFDQMRDEIQALKPEVLRNYYENYFPHIWEKPSLVTNAIRKLLNGKRPFAGKASFLKQRTIPTMQDGIDLGFKPKSWNPVDSFLIKYAEMAQFLMAHQTLQMNKKAGTAKYVRLGKRAPDGWVQADDRIGTVYGREKILNEDKLDEATYEKRYMEGEKGIPSVAREDVDEATSDATIIRGHYYMPAEAAKVFNNFVSRGMAGRSMVYDSLNWLNQNLNALQLGISAFHASTTTINAATSDVALGIQQLAEGKPLKAGYSLAKGLSVAPSIIRTMVNGSHLLRQYLDPGSYAKMAKEAEALAQAGGRVRQNVIELKPLDRIINAWRNGAVIQGLTPIPGAILHAAVAPVMDYYVPRMKLGAFYAMAHDILDEAQKGGWDDAKTRARMQEAWDSIDNRFGQMVYDNLFWHKGLRDSVSLATRSVGWNFGTIREIGGAIPDTARAAGQAATGKMPRVTPRMAFAMALPIVSALVGGILTYLWTGKKPETWKDYFYPRTANGERHSTPGYMKDVFSYAHDPIRTALNKLAPLWQLTSEAIENRDFYGTEIRHKDDPLMKQLVEFASWTAKQAVPFSFSGGAQLLKQRGAGPSLGEMLHAAKEHPGDVALGQLGFQPAPAFIQNSPAMNLAREYSMTNRPPGTKTKEQAAHYDALDAVVRMYRTDEVDEKQIDDYVDKGVLTDKDVQKAERESDEDPLYRVVKNLTIEQMLNVWEKADKDERDAIEPILEAHERDIDKVQDDEERNKLYDAFDKAMGEPEPTPPKGSGGA